MLHAPRSPRRLPPAALSAGLGLALVLAAGCSSSGSATATTVAGASTTAATAAGSTLPSTGPSVVAVVPADPSTTAGTASTAKPGPAAVAIQATVTGKQVTVSQPRFSVPLSSPVTITVTADSNQEVHLHGYDIKSNAAPGSPAVITFTARIPGVFEVELEKSATKLFEIAVS